MKGGVVIENFFIRDFLYKKFSGGSIRNSEGGVVIRGVVIIISPDFIQKS
jgi:hypothetical protein